MTRPPLWWFPSFRLLLGLYGKLSHHTVKHLSGSLHMVGQDGPSTDPCGKPTMWPRTQGLLFVPQIAGGPSPRRRVYLRLSGADHARSCDVECRATRAVRDGQHDGSLACREILPRLEHRCRNAVCTGGTFTGLLVVPTAPLSME